MKLSYEYNEYTIGFIVTDEETGRYINFQFSKVDSNHPTPDYVLKSACEGDETYANFSEDERIEARNWLRSHDDVRELEAAFTKASYENENFKQYSAPLEAWEILEAANDY